MSKRRIQGPIQGFAIVSATRTVGKGSTTLVVGTATTQAEIDRLSTPSVARGLAVNVDWIERES